jgi:hypothetical protein
MEKLLQQWAKAVSNALFYEATGFCAPRGTRRRALHLARMEQQRAQRLERILRKRYGVNPHEALRRGGIE